MIAELIPLGVLSDTAAAKIVTVLGVIGVIVPPILAIFNRPTTSPRVKGILAIVAAIITGLAGYVTLNGLNVNSPLEIVGWILGAYGAITVAYHGGYKPLGITDQIEAGVNNPIPDSDVAPGGPEQEPPPVG